MPLPDGGAWPPTSLAPVYDKLATWSAWYGGDPDDLSQIYGGQAAADQTRTGFFASQAGGFKAGVRGMLQRWFWGAFTPVHEQRTKIHVPLAGDISATSADLLFSEPPTITVDNTGTQDRLDELIDDGMHASLLEGAEIAAALGGVYLRVCWDRDIEPDRPWLAPVHADSAVPEWSYGKLTAVTFWRILADDGREVVRHLERHEKGAILHGVYAGTRDELGRRIALTDMPETEGIAESITYGDSIATGVPYLTATYVPNMRPNRVWRRVPAAAYCGRSDYQGTEGLMDALDETYSSWMRDIRLGKARLIVPDVYLMNEGKGKGARFETEQEVFSPLNAMPGSQTAGLAITPNQFAIRVTEHRDTAQTLLEQIVRGAGYATQTFGEQNDVSITATEVAARERRSFITRDRKIRYWRPGLQDALQALLAIDAQWFGSGVSADERPKIEFGDSVSEDQNTLAQTAQLLRAAEAASTETLVQMVHPDWDEDDVQAEVDKIEAEKPQMDLGGFGDQQPEPSMNGQGDMQPQMEGA